MATLKEIPVAILKYPKELDLRPTIESMLGTHDLEGLHRQIGRIAVVTRENDQKTVIHKRFYDGLDEHFYREYHRFIGSFVQPLFDEPLVFQKTPTFRAHLPHNLAVGEFHKDTNYNHLREAVTFWLPMTDAYESNSVQVELDDEVQAMTVPHGFVMAFDSMNLNHGNFINSTDQTRVSIDFRVVPESQFKPSDHETLNTGMKMNIGGYYENKLLS